MRSEFFLRRRLLVGSGLLALISPTLGRAKSHVAKSFELPHEVAGVAIPRSPIALNAIEFARANYPDFLFNHCIRTFLFGTLYARQKALEYNADVAFVAAALHDLGLLSRFESPQASFEIDSADASEKFMRREGASLENAAAVWRAVELHDGKWALSSRESAESALVAAGAGADVVGPNHDITTAEQVEEIVAAFPRLQFKNQFISILVAHCKRKPLSQRATWLEGMCREQVPSVWTDTTEGDIHSAGFAE